MDDGLAIYTYQDTNDDSGSAGSVISNNIVTHVLGNNTDGIISKYPFAYGIDLDKNSHDIIIEDNTVAYCTGGITLGHGTKNNLVRNNTFMDYALGLSASSPSDNASGTLSGNIFYSTDRNRTFVWWRDKEQRIIRKEGKMVLTAKDNKYVSHYNKTELMDSNGDGYFETFEQWKAATGQDAISKCDVSALEEGEFEKLLINNSFEDKTFNLGSISYKDILGNTLSKSLTLQPFTSKIIIGSNFDGISEINQILDNISPVISSFTVSPVSNGLTVTVTNFTATDNVALPVI